MEHFKKKLSFNEKIKHKINDIENNNIHDIKINDLNNKIEKNINSNNFNETESDTKKICSKLNIYNNEYKDFNLYNENIEKNINKKNINLTSNEKKLDFNFNLSELSLNSDNFKTFDIEFIDTNKININNNLFDTSNTNYEDKILNKNENENINNLNEISYLHIYKETIENNKINEIKNNINEIKININGIEYNKINEIKNNINDIKNNKINEIENIEKVTNENDINKNKENLIKNTNNKLNDFNICNNIHIKQKKNDIKYTEIKYEKRIKRAHFNNDKENENSKKKFKKINDENNINNNEIYVFGKEKMSNLQIEKEIDLNESNKTMHLSLIDIPDEISINKYENNKKNNEKSNTDEKKKRLNKNIFNDSINYSDIKNIFNNIEKKKKIKNIHDEIINLINKENTVDNILNKSENIQMQNISKIEMKEKNFNDNNLHTSDSFNSSDLNTDTKINSLKINENLLDKNYSSSSINEYTDLPNIFKNKYSEKNQKTTIDKNNFKNVHNNVNKFYDYEKSSSNEYIKKEHFKKCSKKNNNKNHNNKIDNNILFHKETFEKYHSIESDYDIKKNKMKRKIKLIFKKKKKYMEINLKNLERFSYFNILLETYARENDCIYMDEHISYKLSKILFNQNIIEKIKKKNFKKIMKSLDYFEFIYENSFLLELKNKITIHDWLNDKKFFNKIFINNFLNVKVFYDLIYTYLYLNKNVINFFFTLNGGIFMKYFLLYDKVKGLKLINKIIQNIQIINPSNNDIFDFLLGLFNENEKKAKLKSIEINNEKNIFKTNENNKNQLNNISTKNKKNKKYYNKNYIQIENKEYKKKSIRNILSKIWLNDFYVKEEICYGKNFIEKIKKVKRKNIELNNFLSTNSDYNDLSEYSYITDIEKEKNFIPNLEDKNSNRNIELTDFNQQSYEYNDINESHRIETETIQDNNTQQNTEITEEQEIIEDRQINTNRKNMQTFNNLDFIPNISFDLISEDQIFEQKDDTTISFCFKEEDKCNVDKYLKDISALGINIIAKENKINYFNCFDVNLKIKIKNNLLTNINYYISNEEKNNLFYPIWPNTPDFFGFKMIKNIKKDFINLKNKIINEKSLTKNNLYNMDLYKENKQIHNNLIELNENKFKNLNKWKLNNFIWANNTYNNTIFDKTENTEINLDDIKIKDCNYLLQIKIYPLRTLFLYVLFNSLYNERNFDIIDFFSKNINNVIKEWLLLFLLPDIINKTINQLIYPLKLTKNIFIESNEFYEDFFSNEFSKINDLEKIIIYTKNCSHEELKICPFFFCYLWLKSCNYKIDKWISSKINEILFTFPYANFLLSKYFINFLLFLRLFTNCLDIDHMYLCKSHLYVSLKHNISFLHESMISVLFSSSAQLANI